MLGLPSIGGTSGVYSGASQAFWQAAAAAVAALQSRRAELRQQQIMRKAVDDPKRLAVADQSLAEGDIDVACIIYTRLALSRTKSAASEAARQKIRDLQEQARKELSGVDAMLPGGDPGKSSLPPALMPVSPGDDPADWLTEAFREYDRLAERYAHLPAVGGERGEISQHRNQLKRRFASQLDEAQAKELWQLGQEYEGRGHQCCAYLVYQEAMAFLPAPSAKLAQQRYETMAEDPEIVASSVTCRQIQWCLAAYMRAEEQLAKGKPDRAQALCRQIVERAPQDSEVYRAAQEWIASGPPR